VWPAIKSFVVYRIGARSDGERGLTLKEVDSGNGVELAWASAGPFGGQRFDRFAVLEPEVIVSGGVVVPCPSTRRPLWR